MWKKVLICAMVALILVPASVLAAGGMGGSGARQGTQSAQAGNCTGDCTEEMHKYGTGNANALGANGTQQAMYKYGSGNAQAGNCTGECTEEMHKYRTANANALGANGTQQAMYKYGSGNVQAGNCTGECTGEMHKYGMNQDSSSSQGQSAAGQGTTRGMGGRMSART